MRCGERLLSESANALEPKAVSSGMRWRHGTTPSAVPSLAGAAMHLLGCGGGNDAPSECTGEPPGFYEIEYSQRSGNCGELSSMLVDMSLPHWSTGDVRDDCVGERQISADACTRQATMTCLVDRTPQFQVLCEINPTLDACAGAPLMTLRGLVTWSPEFDDAEGTLTLSSSGTGADCSGLWDVQLLRQ
jgi:hypothetical protein